MVFTILLVFVFAASLSSGQGISSFPNNGSVMENLAAPTPMSIIDQANVAATANITNINTTAAPNLRYIWSVTGIEMDLITIALNQEGGDLFGQAKYEPGDGEPWNGEVAGLVSGNQVHLVITALEGNKQVSTVLDGIFEDDAISGRFFQASEGEITDRGKFSAIWMNPDLSGYIPAKVGELKPVTTAVIPSSEVDITAPSDINQIARQKSMYHDVHEDADRILTGVGDISQIPIGMGGSGLP